MANRALLTIAAVLALCVRITAQTPTALPTSTSNVVAGSVTGIVSDYFAGRGVVGPYFLSWKGIDVGSEHVVRDAQMLVRGDDYFLDAASGVLTFTAPLKDGQSARVDYSVTPGKAAQNNVPAASPVQLNLLQPGNGFTLNALVRPAAASLVGGASGEGSLLLALAGNSGKDANGSLMTRLYLDASGGNVLDRGGMLLREKKTSKTADFTFGYARAGADFAPGTDSNLTAGKEIIDASSTFRGSHGLTALAGVNRTDDLTSAGNGATLTTYTEQITAAPNAASHFQATHTTAVAGANNTADTVTDTTHVQLDQHVSKVTTVSAVVDRSQVSGGATPAPSTTQSTTVTMTSQPTTAVSVQATVANHLTPTGADDEATLQLKARVTPRISLTAASDDKYSSTAWIHAHSVTTDYAASAKVKLTGGVEQRDQPGRDALTGTISADARPATWSELTGTVKLRDVSVNGLPDPLSPDTYRAGVTLSVGRGGIAKITGAYALNPDDAGGIPVRGESESFGVTGKLGRIEATGGYSYLLDDVASRRTDQVSLGIGWIAGKTTRLDTKYQTSFTRDTNVLATDTYSLNLTHTIASRLDLIFGGTMTSQEQNGLMLPNREYAVNCRVGLRF